MNSFFKLRVVHPYFREGNGTPLQYSFTWRVPWTEEPGVLQSMGSLRVRYDWVTSLSLFTFMHWRRKWQPTPVFLPGESQGRGSLVGCCLWVAQSRTLLKRLSSSSSILIFENGIRKIRKLNTHSLIHRGRMRTLYFFLYVCIFLMQMDS